MEAQLAFRISAIFSDFLNGRLLICRTELLLMTVSCGAEEKPFDTELDFGLLHWPPFPTSWKQKFEDFCLLRGLN